MNPFTDIPLTHTIQPSVSHSDPRLWCYITRLLIYLCIQEYTSEKQSKE